MARNAGVLTFRNIALAIWMACVLLIVIPAVAASSTEPTRAPFRQPVSPPGPHPAMPLKQ